MTLTELKAHLNELRVDPAWKQGWLDRGADFSAVMLTIRNKLLPAVLRNWEAEDRTAFDESVRIILDYVAYRHWEALTLRTGEPETDGDENAAAQLWIDFIAKCNPTQTFKQAMFVFHERHGFWPRRWWPGMPKAEFDKGRRIKDVPRDRLQPGLPADHSNEPITD